MPCSTRSVAISAPFRRSVTIVALMGAAVLANPSAEARALSAAVAPIQLAQAQQAQAATPHDRTAARDAKTKVETVEQRIATLHKALKIMPDEEANWNNVAQAMRQNAASLDALIAANRTASPKDRTAVEDLEMYQIFVQAHVDGLQNLTASFKTLYDAMPDAQKKVADQVFSSSGRRGKASHK